MNWNEKDLASILERRGVPAPLKRVETADRPFAVPADENAADPVTFVLAEPPRGKERARSFIQNGKVVTTTPPKTREYEARIADAARKAMGNRPPLTGPVEISLRAQFAVRKSWPKAKRDAAMVNEIRPTGKPDGSNILKAWEDAMNGIVFVDDGQAVEGHYSKRYGPQALVVVTVRALA